MKVHFMGIGGSGMSAAASLALAAGYEVSGCDLDVDSPYTSNLKDKIEILKGHDKSHIDDDTLLVATPAVYFDDPKPEEFESAGKKMTWQNFMGEYLQKNKEVIAVSGTHGKSTTTAMLSLVFEEAGKDPSVMIGANVKGWSANYRIGKSNLFIVESDEFYDNFLNYSPDAIILNNIEFDHPDYFKTFEQLGESFRKHLKSVKGKKNIVVNRDSRNAFNIANNVGANVISYSLEDSEADLIGRISNRTDEYTEFRAVSKKLGIDEVFRLKLLGDYNVSNALGVIAMSSLYSIEPKIVAEVLNSFDGIGRRMEMLGEKNGVKIYDDYGHHPTAIRETLRALRQKYKTSKIIAVIEPHSYSRTKALLHGYKDAFLNADEVLIAPIFKARDIDTFGVSEKSIAMISDNKNIRAYDSFDKIVEHLNKNSVAGDVIIVMGAGKSYEISKRLLT